MWLLLAIILGLTVYDYYRRLRTQKQMGSIPIISKIPIIGSILNLLTFQPELLHLKFEEYIRKFGNIFYAKVFGRIVVVTADQRYVNELLLSSTHISKNQLYDMLRVWLGDGLLLAKNPRWQSMRKIITPTFHYKILEQFVDVFDQQSAIFVNILKEYADGQTVVDIYPHMGLLALDIIAETAMSVRINAQKNANSEFILALKDVTDAFATRIIRPYLCFPWLFKLFAPKIYEKQTKGIKVMHDYTNKIIQKRRDQLQASQGLKYISVDHEIGIKPKMALLDVLLQATMNGKPLTDHQISEEVNTFLFAGNDTSASAASFCLYLLSRHEECQQKLYEEIEEHFGDNMQRSITYADVNRMSYLNCVIKESLRLYPPIPAIGRVLKEDLKIDDVTLPAKTNVIILLWSMLRNPDVFPEPEKFLPERHMNVTPKMSNVFNSLPFSAGPRNCIGQRFALYELKTIITQTIRHYQLLPLGEDIQLTTKIVLFPKNGAQLGIKSRNKL